VDAHAFIGLETAVSASFSAKSAAAARSRKTQEEHMSNSTATGAVRKQGKKTSRNVSILVVIAAVGGLGYYQYKQTHQPDTVGQNLITAKASRADLIETVAATGSVTAQTGAQVKIGSQITGTIKRLYADIGTQVKAGDPIAILNLPDLDAQVAQAKAAMEAAQVKLQQTKSGVSLEITQTAQNIVSAEAGVKSAEARLETAEANLKQQSVQTPSDIRRAQNALSVAKAALSTARSSLKQVEASAALQISTAQATVTQNQATYNNAAINLKRNKELLQKGYVAGSIVDNAQEATTVAQAQLASAKENVALVKAKVAADLQAAKDGVTQAEQNVQAAEAALDAAKAEPYTDKAKLAAVNDAKQALEQAKSTLKTAQANKVQDTLKLQDVAQAERAFQQAEASYKYNLAQQDKATIRSPISGTVLQLASQQGETLAAGLSSPTLIVVADLNRLQVDAYVDETDIGKVKLGQEASITVEAYSKRPIKGKVVKIASGSTIQQGVVTYDVTIAITDEKHRLKPDMTANVVLQTGKLTNVLVVPSVAIKVSTKGSTVNVVTKKDGKTVLTPHRVKTGGNDEANTEIREGINEGDTVVLAGMDSSGRGGMGPASPFGPSRPAGAAGGGGGRGGGR
jgi:HlyD family secretion protein